MRERERERERESEKEKERERKGGRERERERDKAWERLTGKVVRERQKTERELSPLFTICSEL